jgi:Raf kinase inhibitor-like YbhB/YbcL family protein
MIPAKYGGQMGVSPPLSWTGAPMTTQSFALIMHDLDVGLRGATEDVLHWMIWDIPGTATGLPEGVKAGDQPDGSRQGRGITGQNAYFGPSPPAPTTHHYTIEIYALNAKLNLPPETTRAQLLAAMEGKVVAKGAYNGRFKQ